MDRWFDHPAIHFHFCIESNSLILKVICKAFRVGMFTALEIWLLNFAFEVFIGGGNL